MDNYIFKDFAQVRQWIEDNKLLRYNFSVTKASTTESRENSYVFCYNKDISPEENLRLLERRLQAHAGMRLYGKGWRTEGGNVGGYCCEVEYGYMPDYMQRFERMISPQGVGMQPTVDAEKLERDITEKLTMQFRLNQLESERKEFERQKKEFEEEKSGAIGAILSYFAPVAQAWMQKQGLAKVAGTNVQAEKIVPTPDPQEEPDTDTQGPDGLPDEEAARGYALLVRFRNVEPEYLSLLESVVVMAESGDEMYNFAKTKLLK